MIKIAVRNIEQDLNILADAEVFMREISEATSVTPSILSALEVAKYWTGVAHVLLQHEFIEEVDVFVADRLSQGKSVNS